MQILFCKLKILSSGVPKVHLNYNKNKCIVKNIWWKITNENMIEKIVRCIISNYFNYRKINYKFRRILKLLYNWSQGVRAVNIFKVTNIPYQYRVTLNLKSNTSTLKLKKIPLIQFTYFLWKNKRSSFPFVFQLLILEIQKKLQNLYLKICKS